MQTTKRREAVYGLESSATSDTTVEEGEALLPPDLTVLMPVLAYKQAMMK